jgi:hypothetical protein
VRRWPILLLGAALAGCGGSDGPAPCDLLTAADAEALLGPGLAPIDIPGDDAEVACGYAPEGAEEGAMSTVAAIEVQEDRFGSPGELRRLGEELDGVGEAAIIETETAGFTVIALADGSTSFGLVVRGEGVERDAVVELARTIVDRLTD